mmetsp:Transcript_54743/g.62929  ORF Transcript_54743/g.62929 Transcript_54743/m.62929 type:complete len:232 (+) Transcript_54743:323-1018(+)
MVFALQTTVKEDALLITQSQAVSVTWMALVKIERQTGVETAQIRRSILLTRVLARASNLPMPATSANMTLEMSIASLTFQHLPAPATSMVLARRNLLIAAAPAMIQCLLLSARAAVLSSQLKNADQHLWINALLLMAVWLNAQTSIMMAAFATRMALVLKAQSIVAFSVSKRMFLELKWAQNVLAKVFSKHNASNRVLINVQFASLHQVSCALKTYRKVVCATRMEHVKRK